MVLMHQFMMKLNNKLFLGRKERKKYSIKSQNERSQAAATK